MINKLLYKIAQAKISAVPEPYVHAVHAGIALVVVLTASIWIPKALAAFLMLLIAGSIEFWFDKHYEGQSFKDNLHDFEDYLIGVLLALLI